MNAETFEHTKKGLLDLAEAIATAKRPGYTHADLDVLRNFKQTAELLGITPMQVWGTFAMKHVSAILSHAKDPNIPQAEAIVGRYADLVNYLTLGHALIAEEETK